MTPLVFRAPVCPRSGCAHEFIDHIGPPPGSTDLDRIHDAGSCTRPGCRCQSWLWPDQTGA